MDIVNLSAEPEGRLRSWLPPHFRAEKVVFLPDACPGRSPLPTGTASLLRDPNWRRYAVSDCGCGMRLVRSTLQREDLTVERWDRLAARLRLNKDQLGDLGGGNHFLDALEPYDENVIHFLVHTGSRNESGLVDELIERPAEFDREFARVVHWARSNRAAIQDCLESEFGPMELVLDLPHNTWESQPDGSVIIRKGAVHLPPGELSVLPSHMSGDVVLIRGTEALRDTLCSMSHGTGRSAARGKAKNAADSFDFGDLRRRILIPTGVGDSSLRTEGPYAYRDLDACLELIQPYITVVQRFAVAAYMGHL